MRRLTARDLLAFAFSKDGSQVYGIIHNPTGEGAQWQLYSIDVKTAERRRWNCPNPRGLHDVPSQRHAWGTVQINLRRVPAFP